MAAAPVTETTDTRLTRLESDVTHIRSDLADIKTDIRDIRRDLIGLRDATHKEMGELSERVSRLSKAVTNGDLVNRIWMLVLCGVMLGVMARGFHWI